MVCRENLKQCLILSECNNPIDLVFMLDSSGSINEANFKRVLNFIRELAGRLDVEGGSARISVMTFADSNTLVGIHIFNKQAVTFYH